MFIKEWLIDLQLITSKKDGYGDKESSNGTNTRGSRVLQIFFDTVKKRKFQIMVNTIYQFSLNISYFYDFFNLIVDTKLDYGPVKTILLKRFNSSSWSLKCLSLNERHLKNLVWMNSNKLSGKNDPSSIFCLLSVYLANVDSVINIV